MPRLLALALLLAAGAALGAPYRQQVRVSLPNFEIAPLVLGQDEDVQKPGLLVASVRAATCRESRADCTALPACR